MDYKKNIAKFDIVNKEGQSVNFVLNAIQERLISGLTGRDIVLKARQIGCSSAILAMFTLDFLGQENSRSVCLSQDTQAAQRLLDRVKYFIKSAEDKGLAVNLKYNSRNEMVNDDKNSTFYIGQAGSKSFGRGDTLTNLHISEWAFFNDPEAFLASALQAVVPHGRVVIESTPNGTNYFKTFWDKSKKGETGFKTHFFDRTFYSQEFLDQKKKELGDQLFEQEYPANDLDCFLSSGNPFFDTEAMKYFLSNIKEPLQTFTGYYDLPL